MNISYKNVQYTFNKSAEKIDGRVLVPSPLVKACNFLGFVEYFFWNSPQQPSRCKGQATRSIDENCPRVTSRQSYPARAPRWLGRKIFSAQSAEQNSTTSGTGSVRLPHLPVYKSTFYSLKISPKNCPRLIHGSKTEIKKVQDKLA